MTRRTSQTVTEHITCDVCGTEWEEESTKIRDKTADDLCAECKDAYDAWKANRRKETYKALK